MKLYFINFLRGTQTLCAKGTFPERIINIAKEKEIFIQNITRENDALIFTVSFKGAQILLSTSFDNLEITPLTAHGLPHIFSVSKKRFLLVICPPIVLSLLFLSTLFIWNVNIIDADPIREKELLSALSDLGVKRGAFKHKIDPSEIKKQLLLSDEKLLWIWVDIKGSGAIVRFAERTLPPSVPNENEGVSIVSKADCVITHIIATQGTARVNVGDRVKKGDVLIEGTIPKNSEELKPIHSTGHIFGSVLREKVFQIPKKSEHRTPTGKKTQHLTVKISNFPIKLFINSRILYSNYDIIESKRKIKYLPVSFHKTEYMEVIVSHTQTDVDIVAQNFENSFIEEEKKLCKSVNHVSSVKEDYGDYILLTVKLLCEEDIAKERRIYIGENNSVLFS